MSFSRHAALGALAMACVAAVPVRAQPELIEAFAFGSRQLDCPTHSEPGVSYTMVVQTSPDDIQYSAVRGWGYEVVNPGDAGYGRFGPFDDSPNDRAVFPDTCPSELYDSFIGAKNFVTICANLPAPPAFPCDPPEGIIFRIDVPNGLYRFAAAAGSADNEHAHRIVVEDGGSGPPAAIGPNQAVLIDNFDQAADGPGVFARVGFDGHIPPTAAVFGFVDFDEDGSRAAGPPSSPTLQVTQGYIRLHQLKGSTIGTDGNGGDMVIFEAWRVEGSFNAIRRGSTWKYFQGLQEASSPDPASWRELGFDDGSWASGAAPFGYGDPPFGTDVSLLDPPMRDNYTTLFLRQTFELAVPAAVNQLVANVDYDDGFMMWINGVEVLRINVDGLPGDPVSYDGLSSSGHESGLYEEYFLPDPVEFDYLVAGTNVVAVQVFNTTITSSDLKLDLDLYDPVAPDVNPPEVSALVPAAGTTIRSLTQVVVTFTEDVARVDASDLLVDGAPATGITGSGKGPYTFAFDPAPPGVVQVEWAADHGIVDLADFPNDFAGGGWTYTVDPDAPIGQLVITEFLAANRSGILDEDGERSDWVEICNQGFEAVNIAGWSLTDDAEDDGRWTFPNITLGPQEYLVVFASGKDRKPTNGNVHTNWSLGSTGEYLGLYNAESPRQVVSEFAPRYPNQRADFSYGIDTSGNVGYFETPTPGAPSGGNVNFDGFVLDPVFTPDRGLYSSGFPVTISTPTAGADIRYTLDGSEPTPTQGTPYSGAFQVTGTPRRGVVTVRAIAYLDGLLPSDVITHSYIFPAHVMTQPRDPDGFPGFWNGQPADYEMDPQVVNDPGHEDLILNGLQAIPTLSVVGDVNDLFSNSRGILANPSMEGVAWERPVSAELIYPDGSPGFQINCGIRVQGGSSTRGWKVLKVSMRLLFKGDYGPTKLRFPLFPDSPVEQFDTILLDAHLNQTWNHPSHGQRVRAQYCRDQYVSDLQNAAGGYAPHDIFAHLYVNGLYWGLYDLHERPDASFAAEYFGGDKTEYDALRHSGSTVVDGSAASWNEMMSAARRDLSSNSNYLALHNHLDVPNLVDYMIVNFYAGNTDWAHHNWYATRRRLPGAGYRIHSWDAEHVLKSVTENRTGQNNSNAPTEVFQRLRANDEFRLLFADHAHRHLFNGGMLYVNPSSPDWDPYNPGNNMPASLYMRRIEEADSYVSRIVDPEADRGSPIACEAARWGDVRREPPYTRNSEWLAELNWLLNLYFPDRSANVLAQFRSAGLYPGLGAPVFSRHGGRIDPGFELTMSKPAGTPGTLYYTTDGSDPRVFGTGAVATSAEAYTGPVILNDHATVRARVLNGDGDQWGEWSALNEATFTFIDAAQVVRITEIMYNPFGGSDFEFLEFQNIGDATVGLSGALLTNGVTYVFPEGVSLGPGEFLVLVADSASFESAYPGVDYYDVYNGRLANGGETVTLRNSVGEIITSADYDDDGFWPVGADGFGYSMVAIDPGGDLDDPDNWRASAEVGGSPGEEDPPGFHGGVVVNEVLANSAAPLEDAIELFNRTAAPIDVGGWYLSNDRQSAANLRKYRVPNGTVVPAGGYAVFYESQFNSDPGSASSFELDHAGGAVYLTAADAAGNLTGYIMEARYGPEEDGVSFGSIATTSGLDFGAMSERSFGADFPSTVEEFRTGTGMPNSAARFGPAVINEIMYNPGADREEFVELFNPTASAISLYDDASGRGWQLSGIRNAFELESYEFGPGAEIPAQGFLLVVGIDPGVFRNLHAVPASVPIHGPYGGKLDNGGERVQLSRPALMEPPPGEDRYILVDQVRYDDVPPWPVAADGFGKSLERLVATSYGNDAVNWGASTRRGGTPGALNSVSDPGGNRPPVAIFRATPSTGNAPLEVLLDATQSYDLDGEIVSFSWDFDDGATGDQEVETHTFQDQGIYVVTLIVEDDDGATDSEIVLVTVDADLGGGQIPGDANQDGGLDISDAISLLQQLFLGGAPLACDGVSVLEGGNRLLLDLNDDNGVDLSDAVSLLSYLFRGGPEPALGTGCLLIPGCPDVCVP